MQRKRYKLKYKAKSKRISDLVVLAHFTNNYHSGQWSRGYKLLCWALKRLEYYGIMRPIDRELTSNYELRSYIYLIENYVDKV